MKIVGLGSLFGMSFAAFISYWKPHNLTMKRLTLSLLSAVILPLFVSAQTLDIHLDKPGAAIQSTMYGIFFEDINFAADGGLYAELVKNRSFEYLNNPLQGWKAFGKVQVREDGPFDRCPHYVRLLEPGHPHKITGLENEGYFGIGIKEGEQYRFSVWARVPEGGSSELRIALVHPASMNESQILCENKLEVKGTEWTQYELLLTSPCTLDKAALRIFLSGNRATVDLEHISLFPVDTWKGHRNGMRKDLAQALYDLHPGIFRFPGGCIVEGTDLDTRYNWKNTVGPVENRPLNVNRWQYCFDSRFFPDYYQSYGLGFYEFFQLSEELGSEPLPILSCGLACQFQNDSMDAHVPVDQLDPYIQDALDLIEFANGPVNSTWGKVRADMGHPAPFNLKYIGIGNEQWGREYPERLAPFVKAIRAAHPEIKIVGSAGPFPEGEEFEKLWSEMQLLGADLVDEHYYRPYEWFLSQAGRYDQYGRSGPKVFAGEYACHADGKKYNHYYASLMEAAFMTGLERNADLVQMATYAPLFAHVEGWQWRPDLIWFDNLRTVRTASWHVQQLYSQYKGEQVIPLTLNGKPVTGADGLFASAVRDGDKVYVKVVNTSEKQRNLVLSFGGKNVRAVTSVLFASDQLYRENTLDEPNLIVPQKMAFQGDGSKVDVAVDPLSFSIYILQIL